MKVNDKLPCHECAPAAWRKTHDITGSYELDAGIERSNNTDLPARLRFYTSRDTNLYGSRSAYNGYHGYSGDD